MRKTSALTWTLLLLVLLPSGILAWLGLRSADAFASSELQGLRSQVQVELDLWRARGPQLESAVAASIQEPLDAWAEHMAEGLPGQSPQAIARALGELRDVLGADRVLDLRLLDAAGRQLYPVPHGGDVASVSATDMTRSAVLVHLSREADRAYYGEGGEAAAVAVWERAAEAAESEGLRALFHVEAARVRARKGIGPAITAARDLDARYDLEALRGVGRPVILLWAVAAGAMETAANTSFSFTEDGPQSVYTNRLRGLVEDGTIDATPLSVEERRRVRQQARIGGMFRLSASSVAGGAESPAVAFRSGLPGGASVVARISGAGLARELPQRMKALYGNPVVSGPAPYPRRIWIDGATDLQSQLVHMDGTLDPLPASKDRFRLAARGVVDLPLPGGGAARTHILLNRWLAVYEASRDRTRWTIAAILLLVALTLGGAFLMRRAILREREARRVRDDFIANVTHEVRTPLTSVLLHSELLIEQGDDDAKRQEHAAVVQAQGQRLAALVGDMLDFAALERGTRTLESSPVDLAAACRDAVAPYKVLAEREGADVTFVEPDGPAEAMADPAALARILGNLVGNAWKHGRPSRDGHPGRLRMLAREDARGGIVEVRDDGPGIPEEERDRVFERFGRGRAAIRKEGSGIGLSLSKDLAQAMGGDLTIHEKKGETVFRLRLAPIPDLDPDTA